MYISPSLEYAKSYWGENWVAFSAKINSNDIRKESEFDWVTITDTKIERFRYV
jgi:hypothetical protein